VRKVIANEWLTLDGVVQAPSYADEDLTGGFEHGGRHARYFDDLSMNWVIENVRGAGGFVLGRGTYQMFAAHWPTAPEDQQMHKLGSVPCGCTPDLNRRSAADGPVSSRSARGQWRPRRDQHDPRSTRGQGYRPTIRVPQCRA
jgi:hypothetical protein